MLVYVYGYVGIFLFPFTSLLHSLSTAGSMLLRISMFLLGEDPVSVLTHTVWQFFPTTQNKSIC